ncbi:hypothetical protein Tco_0418190 [Tanacetum coccineum]
METKDVHVVLSKEDLKGTRIKHGFKRAFMSLFGQDDDTFSSMMFLNVDQLQKQLDKYDFQEESMAAFWVINGQFQKFIDSQFTLDYDSQMSDKYFSEYTGIEVKQFRETLLQHMNNVKKSVAERTRHQRQYDRRFQPIYDEELMAEVQLTAECNIFATGQQHTEQPKIINEGRVDQYTKKCQVKGPVLDSSVDNKTTEFSNQSLGFENIFLKKDRSPFQKFFSKMEAHCIALELKYQNQALKSRQHGQILNETSNKVKMKKEKVFAIASLKNELRKLKGNSVDTKFAKPSVLEKPDLQPLITNSLLGQSNGFKSERPKSSKPRFASQVDLKKYLSKPVTQHYLPKGRESAITKPHHVIASSASRNSSKNMLIFSSNDMVHNHYLEEAKKKTQEKDRNSKSSVMHSTRLQNTIDDSKPKPRRNKQTTRSLHVSKSSCLTSNVVLLVDHSRNSSPFSDSKHFVCSTCQKCIFNANHDACITKFLKEVNSRAKIQSHTTRNSNKPKTSPRSDLRWKPTGIIFKTTGHRWIHTGKLFDSCTSKADSESTHGSNVDISKIHECKQTLDLSAGTPINVQKEQSIDLSAVIRFSIHRDDGNPSSVNIKQALRSYALSGKSCQDVLTILNLHDHGSPQGPEVIATNLDE